MLRQEPLNGQGGVPEGFKAGRKARYHESAVVCLERAWPGIREQYARWR